ncbi:hypothetical protein C7M84_001528 [Penaeus vannamei]|uniref:Uncharacterized protein n=1 Tax=Penaeus vannamei TaxID=6689 RepID=A0A423TTK0_PENVA|nr:hypothetical protein C7M84_001528 [Penaeus vannamei]
MSSWQRKRSPMRAETYAASYWEGHSQAPKPSQTGPTVVCVLDPPRSSVTECGHLSPPFFLFSRAPSSLHISAWRHALTASPKRSPPSIRVRSSCSYLPPRITPAISREQTTAEPHQLSLLLGIHTSSLLSRSPFPSSSPRAQSQKAIPTPLRPGIRREGTAMTPAPFITPTTPFHPPSPVPRGSSRRRTASAMIADPGCLALPLSRAVATAVVNANALPLATWLLCLPRLRRAMATGAALASLSSRVAGLSQDKPRCRNQPSLSRPSLATHGQARMGAPRSERRPGLRRTQSKRNKRTALSSRPRPPSLSPPLLPRLSAPARLPGAALGSSHGSRSGWGRDVCFGETGHCRRPPRRLKVGQVKKGVFSAAPPPPDLLFARTSGAPSGCPAPHPTPAKKRGGD